MQAFQLRKIARPKSFLIRCISRERASDWQKLCLADNKQRQFPVSTCKSIKRSFSSIHNLKL